MPTPFTQFANATLTFKVRSGDPVYGDYGHLVATLQDAVVECYLTQDSNPASDQFPGANQEEIAVSGRCISPTTLPSDIQPETLADAVVDGEAFKFRYVPSVQSPFYPENAILGQRIQGFLIKTTTMGGAA